MKIKVIVKNPSDIDEIFAIPVLAGEFGTPRTVRWLMNETARRYRSLYKKAVTFAVAFQCDTLSHTNSRQFNDW
jgi:hypothetical protein